MIVKSLKVPGGKSRMNNLSEFLGKDHVNNFKSSNLIHTIKFYFSVSLIFKYFAIHFAIYIKFLISSWTPYGNKPVQNCLAEPPGSV